MDVECIQAFFFRFSSRQTSDTTYKLKKKKNAEKNNAPGGHSPRPQRALLQPPRRDLRPGLAVGDSRRGLKGKVGVVKATFDASSKLEPPYPKVPLVETYNQFVGWPKVRDPKEQMKMAQKQQRLLPPLPRGVQACRGFACPIRPRAYRISASTEKRGLPN